MIAINSALAIDLTGQVAADTLLGRFFSGIGGQVDFVRGAARSRGGKPIIALPSTAKDGELSRIRPVLEEGAGIVTSRGDVRYVVTEYGVADLWGKSIRQRALSLIEIAHPDFRAELLTQAKARHYVFPNQLEPRAAYAWEQESLVEIRGGEQILIRPVRMSDSEALQDLLYRLSVESTYQRFFQYKKAHPDEEIQALVDLDEERNLALVACRQNRSADIVGMVRYDVDPATGLADLGFVVLDEWQGRGIGSALMRRVAEIGKARGLAGFTADVLPTNELMLGVFHQCGLIVNSELDAGVFRMTLRFPPPQRSSTAAPGTGA
jgi:ribosomal protein S18 acetylase RimI-like enzyme